MIAGFLILFAFSFVQQPPPECLAANPPFVVNSGAPFTITWVMDATVPASPTDPTPVPHRINGFFLQIDAGAKQDIGLATAGQACPAGTPQAGRIPYVYRTPSGVARGTHTARLSAWNYVLDASGNATTLRQEGAAVSVPFDAVDPMQLGPPFAPLNLIIKR